MIAGRYSLEREIGRGGAGVVWLGRDEVLHRKVALKRIGLLPGADRTDLARAEREAQLTARLNHPHAVGVFDVAIDEADDAHWLVMEYVEGSTLGQLVRERGRLSPDEAAPLLWQVADALVAAHGAGIVHRDVKPSNVLVDRNGHVKLTDFGIARIESDVTLTRTGMVTGSPAYIAPEIASGDRGNEASDVWSLGATVFHVLAGRPPYEMGENVLGMLYRIVNEDPPRLHDAGWMAPLLERTMVREPSDRWSMEQVRDFLSRDPDDAPPLSAPVPRSASRDEPDSDTQVMSAAAPTPPVAPRASAVRAGERSRFAPIWAMAIGLCVLLVGALAVYAVVTRDGERSQTAPTEQGIESFIRDYVDTVAEDPEESWQMLTPKFQQESGGFETYREFWEPATNGRVLSISANPDDLTVSYQVRFDNFDNGPGPTVLDLEFEDGRYLIDGERTEGFTPAD